jgi:hypothetical protein
MDDIKQRIKRGNLEQEKQDAIKVVPSPSFLTATLLLSY